MNLIAYAKVDVSLELDMPDRLPSGKLCLEYANTLYWHASDSPVESLHNFDELVDWSNTVGIRGEQAARHLKSQGNLHPALALQVYQWAMELREAIYRIFTALSHSVAPDPFDISLINEALPHALTLPELVELDGRFGLYWRGDDNGLDGFLWPIIRSTARLLVDGDAGRIGQCADDRGCGYLFYDTSRNRSRRWCDMNSCGNRAKSHRHYARRRKNAG